MAKTNYSKAELTALIKETQAQLADIMTKSEPEVELRKDEDGPPKKEDASPAEDKSPAESAPADDASSAPPADASSAPPPAAEAAPASPPPAADPAAAAGSAGGDSVETLKAAYSQLAPEALKAHFMALKEVIAASMAPPMADPMAASASAPSAAPAAPAAPPMAAGGSALPSGPTAPMDPGLAMKSEKELLERLAKMEADHTARTTELEKSLGSVTKAFELLMRKPERKAIRGKDYVPMAKSESAPVDVTKLSKAELSKALNTVASNRDLRKSDRELINGYFANKVKVADLQVLFNKE